MGGETVKKEFVRKLELSEEVETKVLYENAIQVYAIRE